jgi:hypothetical protein
MPRIVEAHWEFHCPDCGFGHHELGRLAEDHEIFCVVCDHETGRIIRLERWLTDEPLPQARLRAGLDA